MSIEIKISKNSELLTTLNESTELTMPALLNTLRDAKTKTNHFLTTLVEADANANQQKQLNLKRKEDKKGK